jgi:alpha-1,6-mannosyltransferase
MSLPETGGEMAGLPHAAPRPFPGAIAGRRAAACLGLAGVAGFGLAHALELGGLRASPDDVALGVVAWAGGYAVVVWAGAAVPRAPALVVTVLLLAAFTLAPPHRGYDVYAYVAYGRMAAEHVNPYAHGPGVLGPWDPISGYYAPVFAATPSKYGPLFTLLCTALYPLGALGATWALKLLSGLAAAAVLLLVQRAAVRAGRDPTAALVFAGLNPLFGAYAVAGAHNDLLMAALVLLGLDLAARGRDGLGAAATVVAAAIKPTAALVIPLLVAGRRRALVGAAAAGALVTAGAVALYGDPTRYALILERDGDGHNGRSLPELLRIAAGVDPFTPAGHRVLLGLFALVYATLLLLVWRRRMAVDTASAWAMAALLALSPVVLAWYIVLLLALAAGAPSRGERGAALALTAAFVALSPARHLLGL